MKTGGQIGIAGAGLMQEIQGAVPNHLRDWWEPSLWCLHSAEWWRRHWERTGIVTVELAEAMPNGWQIWLDWQRIVCPDNGKELQALEADRGRYLGYIRAVGRRGGGTRLEDPIVSFPTNYQRQPLLRGSDLPSSLET